MKSRSRWLVARAGGDRQGAQRHDPARNPSKLHARPQAAPSILPHGGGAQASPTLYKPWNYPFGPSVPRTSSPFTDFSDGSKSETGSPSPRLARRSRTGSTSL